MTTKLTIEYDGGGFAGWVRQPGLRTVQEELERALRTVLGDLGDDGEPLTLTVAGRTDSGVHAWEQVASYAHEAVDPLRLNGLLDDDVAVLSRTYCYRVLRRRARSVRECGRALWWVGELDVDALAECARAVVGRHDFRAFTPTETEHSRFERDVLRAEWNAVDVGRKPPLAQDGANADAGVLLEFWIEAHTFMRHMSRVLVGTMLDVAAGAMTVEEFKRLLEGSPREQAGKTAPAHGLALAGVSYA
jgi:tRNA pseudouridine38-40 synthase